MAMRGRGRGGSDVVRGFDGKASVMTQNRRVKEAETGRLHAKTFGAWANSYLRQRGLRINDLTTDLSDGVLLIQLLEIVSGTTCPEKYHAKPTLEIQKVENVLVATRFINQYANINVNPKDVVSGNIKVVLGIMWRLILHFGVEQRRPDEPPPATPPKPQTAAARNREIKQRLLDWVNDKIASYGLHVTDFEQSFQDGLAFAALVHKFDESSFDFARLDPRNPTANLQLAFNLAEQTLGIQPMLDPLDMCSPNPEARPDEQCIITYLSQFPKAFLAATHTLPPIPTRAAPQVPEATAVAPPTPATPAPVIDFPSLPARSVAGASSSTAGTAQPASYGSGQLDGSSRYALPDPNQYATSAALYGNDSSQSGGFASPASLGSSDLGALPVPSRPLPKPTKALPAFPGADAYASKPLPDPSTASFGSTAGAGVPAYIDPNASAAAFGQLAFGDEYASQYGSMQDGDRQHYGSATASAHQRGEYGGQMPGAGFAQYGDASHAGYGSPAAFGAGQGGFVGGAGVGAAPSPSSAAYEEDLARREEEWRRKEDEWRRREAEMQQTLEQISQRQQALATAAANPASSEEAHRIAAENLRLQQQLIIIRQNKIGQLTVIVREARNLLGVNLTGKSDPYVVIIYKEQKERTRTVSSTLSPRWNQEYTFYVQGALATLFLTIYNQNMATADKFIGKIELPLSGLIDGQPLERWFQLQPKKPGKRISGEIKLYLLYRLNTL